MGISKLDDHDRTWRALLEDDPWPGQGDHLAECASCRELTRRLKIIDELLRPLRAVQPPPDLLDRLRLSTRGDQESTE